MNTLVPFLRLDSTLLFRNKLFHISAIITIIYIGLFYLLKPLGNTHIPLIVLIYNDPVIMGYMFAGVLWLFDKNQNTIQAISVLPISKSNYIISKVITLSILAVILSFIMALSAVGIRFNPIHLTISVFLSSVMFCCLGFIIGSISSNFLAFLMKSLPVFILFATPVTVLFDGVNPVYFILVPSLGSILVMQSAFVAVEVISIQLGYIHMCFWTAISIFVCYRITIPRLL